MTERQLEDRVRAWFADEVGHADAPATLAAAVDRVPSTVPAPRLGWRRVFPSSRPTALIVLVALALVALVGSIVMIGAMRDLRLPAILPPEISTDEPSSAPRPSPTAVVSASPSQPIVRSGTAASAIGQVSWTQLRGDATNIPAGDIFETPGGFAAIENDPGAPAPRFWLSTDGLEWAVAELPVPAAGEVRHGFAAGEHWIWSTQDFGLWRSTDFANWTKVDLDAVKPPTVAGIDWGFWSLGPTTVGTTTVFPWEVGGLLALDELLGIPLEAGEELFVESGRNEPALGELRHVYRARQTINGPDERTQVTVGSIRVESDGTIVTITDAERDVTVAEIDSETVGIPAETLAANLNLYGFTGSLLGGAVISDFAAETLTPPPDLIDVVASNSRFVGLTQDRRGAHASWSVWTSSDGRSWQSLGTADVPSSTSATVLPSRLLRRPGGADEERLTAVVLINEAGGQRSEMWSSADALTWVRDGLVYTYPEPALEPFVAPSGGYFATGDDLRIHVSPTGADWTPVEGLEDVGQDGLTVAVTQEAAFLIEPERYRLRVMWVLRVDAESDGG